MSERRNARTGDGTGAMKVQLKFVNRKESLQLLSLEKIVGSPPEMKICVVEGLRKTTELYPKAPHYLVPHLDNSCDNS